MKRTISIVMAGGMMVAGSAMADVGGFVDAQLYYNAENKAGISAEVFDAAVKLHGKAGNTSAMFDLDVADVASQGGGLMIGDGESQAFVHHMYGNGVSWQLGKFDTLYGMSSNDTVDIFWARQGLVYGAITGFTGTTHTGATVGYESGNFGVTLLGANAVGNSSAVTGQNPNIGARFTFDAGLDFEVGALYRKVGDGNDLGIDVVIGGEFDSIDAGLVFAYLSREAAADAGMAFGLDLIYNMGDDMGIGLRPEFLTKVANHQQLQLTAGPRWMMSENVSTKVNYTFNTTTAVEGADADSNHEFAVAAVYGF